MNYRIPRAGDRQARELEQQRLTERTTDDLIRDRERLTRERQAAYQDLLCYGNRFGGESVTRKHIASTARSLRMIGDVLAQRSNGDGTPQA